ncbi:PTS fructose transporter subunit IIB [Paramicrobacterium chengjingii]|uniref:PTS EIIB type-2 domain-containing protein n=1 Tax=Paramicrobacterium chengjingii TaxID=2769067 RepID=A0ABX6YIT1_9MICO|nr:PTS fructose transporter subunit IIB [Microbacterium chengjingii]QPZ38311.1 hypothetical protein HCR76_16235 [Microbacterium chengjingii]
MINVIAVTSCATGIAHSYMAAEAIKKLGKKNGWKVRIEIQGAMGVEDRLKSGEIEGADVLVLANDVGLTDGERFDSLKARTISMTPHSVIQSPDNLASKVQALVEQGA